MRERAEEISNLNRYIAVQCIGGCIINKFKKVFHKVVSNEDNILKYGYDNKALADMIRLKEFLKRYIDGISYRNCLISENCGEIIEIKTNPKYTITEAEELVDDIVADTEDIIKYYTDTHVEYIRWDLVDFIDNITEACCKALIAYRRDKESWQSLYY